MTTGFETNLAIFKTWGLDPARIHHGSTEGGPTIHFDKALGPIVTLDWILHRDGKSYVEGDDIATVLKQYRLIDGYDDEAWQAGYSQALEDIQAWNNKVKAAELSPPD